MYFGTLVTRTREDQDDDTWKRESLAIGQTTDGRWHALWLSLRRLFG